jgi:hypothetical protein
MSEIHETLMLLNFRSIVEKTASITLPLLVEGESLREKN